METPQVELPSRGLRFCLRGANEGAEGLVQNNAWRLISKVPGGGGWGVLAAWVNSCVKIGLLWEKR